MSVQDVQRPSHFARGVLRDLGEWWKTEQALSAPQIGFVSAPNMPHHRDLWQHFDELASYVDVLSDLAPRTIALEIGLYRGGTHFVWKRLFPEVISIDADYWACCKGAIEFSGGGSTFLYGNSGSPETIQTLADILAGRQVDQLFIDGDHEYEAVVRDFRWYAPFVRKGGVIGFHDAQVRLKGYGVRNMLVDLEAGRVPGWGRTAVVDFNYHPGDKAMGITYFHKQ